MTFVRKNNTQQNNGGAKPNATSKGPQIAKYDPSTNGGQKVFKDGAKANATDPICKKRYQQITVTALGNLTTTNSSRIL
jgi:hypothetical protein